MAKTGVIVTQLFPLQSADTRTIIQKHTPSSFNIYPRWRREAENEPLCAVSEWISAEMMAISIYVMHLFCCNDVGTDKICVVR